LTLIYLGQTPYTFVSDKSVEKIKTHILCLVTFFFVENRAV